MKQIANRFFYRVDGQGHPVPGTLARFNKKPVQGLWVEVNSNICCPTIVGGSGNWFELGFNGTGGDLSFTLNDGIVLAINSADSTGTRYGGFGGEAGDVIRLTGNNDLSGFCLSSGIQFIIYKVDPVTHLIVTTIDLTTSSPTIDESYTLEEGFIYKVVAAPYCQGS